MYATFGRGRWERETALNFLSQGYHEEKLLNCGLLAPKYSTPCDSPEAQEACDYTFERLLWILDLILFP